MGEAEMVSGAAAVVEVSSPARPAAEWAHINDLVPWAENPTAIGEAEIQEAISSFKRFGFGAALVGWGSRRLLVGGHVRRRAVIRIVGLEPSFTFDGSPGPGWVPIRWVEFSSEAEAHAYALRDNNRIGAYDEELLKAVAQSIEAAGSDLDGLGFDEEELEKLRAQADEAGASGSDGAGEGEGGGSDEGGDLQPVIHYDIIFDDEGQQGRWYDLLRALKKRYPDHATVASRLDAWLAQNPVPQ